MKRLVYAVSLVALVGAGCAVMAQSDTPANDRPVVTLTNGVVAVQPDPAHFARGKRDVVINWRLPRDAKYRFADNGITIDGEVNEAALQDPKRGGTPRGQAEVVDCRRTANGMQFTCLNRNTRRGVFKYTVRLVDERGAAVAPFDPYIFNE